MSYNLGVVLEFLTELHNMGRSYSKVNVHRSMLSVTLTETDGSQLSTHSRVTRILKGCFNCKAWKEISFLFFTFVIKDVRVFVHDDEFFYAHSWWNGQFKIQ